MGGTGVGGEGWGSYPVEVCCQRARDVLLTLLDHASQPLQLLDPELQGASLARVEGGSGTLHDFADFAHGA